MTHASSSVRTLLAAFAMIIAAASAASGQTGVTRPVGRIAGVVLDSATGQPARRSAVCTLLRVSRLELSSRCGAVDSLGQYHVDSLPLGTHRFSASCATIKWMGKLLTSDSVTLLDSSIVRRDWTVSTTGCDVRPIRRVTGVFRGYYTPGFEASEFVPCESDAWFVPGDSLGAYPYEARRAWATVAPATMQAIGWPKTTRDRYGNPRYYVRWRGTVVGPGNYGHMGVSPFDIEVDTIFALREPNQLDCRAVGRRGR
jgi:hypothetical protein